MKQLLQNNDKWYVIHRAISLSNFTNKDGSLKNAEITNWKNYLPYVDHVLKNSTHFLFVETVQDAVIIEELVEETHH
jgi:hypothetical protein